MPANDPATSRYGKAAAGGLLAAVVAMATLWAVLLDTGLGNVTEGLIGFAAGVVIAALAWALAFLAARVLASLPVAFATALAAALLALWFLQRHSMAAIARAVLDTDGWQFWPGWPTGLSLASMFVLALAAGLVAATVSLARAGRLPEHPYLIGSAALAVAGSIAVLVSLSSTGSDPFPVDYSPAGVPPAARDRPGDPSMPGAYAFAYYTYGAGENPRRPEFGARRRLESRVVDATQLLPEWKGFRKAMRERYWGFGLDAAPLNGLAWVPDGGGPFPLVLIVHGNHGMEDVSDPGYAYLGELLASRGMIAVSVDQNYINGSWSGDFRGKEMAARAWLLLEHLDLWRDWNADAAHPFAGRVDTARIALIGHSRGGEAVSIAYAFNDLPHFPDDATVPFDYGFGIRSLVAVAQVDQRYRRRVRLADVNFLTLHGSYDADEPAYHGMRQFNRIALSDDAFRFKAGIYVHGANHGQFNSTWGRTDYSPPEAWLLNLAPLIPAEDQQQVAKSYIGAFLEATLKDDERYLPMFRDPRVAAGWLPDHPYVAQYRDSTFLPVATFEEDLDVTTGTAAGSAIRASGFSLWREEELRHRDERLQGTSAVVLGWSEDAAPRYTIRIPAGLFDNADSGDRLSFSISGSTETPPPDDDQQSSDDEDDAPAAPAFTLTALRPGNDCSLRSADFAAPAPPFRVRYLKHEAENEARYNDVWEPVLQYVEVPLGELACGGSPTDIGAIEFRFGAMPEGVVILDDIGLHRSLPTEANAP